MSTICVTIHTGHLSFDNGAVAPLTFFRELGEAIGVERQWGSYYGDDRLDIPETDWPTAQALLDDHGMLYKLPGDEPSHWRNVRTEAVRARLN